MTTIAALLFGFVCGYGVRELISRRRNTGDDMPSDTAERCEQFLEGGIRLFFNKSQYQCRVLFQPGCASPARLQPRTAGITPALPPLTAVLTAIPKSSAASCRDTPDATASITRLRISAE
jgi:hypothetical protein